MGGRVREEGARRIRTAEEDLRRLNTPELRKTKIFIEVGDKLAEKVDKVFVDGVEVYAINVDTEKGVAEIYDKETFEVKQITGKIELTWKENKE